MAVTLGPTAARGVRPAGIVHRSLDTSLNDGKLKWYSHLYLPGLGGLLDRNLNLNDLRGIPATKTLPRTVSQL